MKLPTRLQTAQLADATAYWILVAGSSLVVVAFWPSSSDPFVEPKFMLLRVVALGGLLGSAFWVVTARPSIRINIADGAVMVFLVAQVISLIASTNPATSFVGEPLQRNGFVTWIALLAAYTVSRLVTRTRSRLIVFVGAAFVAGSVVALYGLVQLIGIDPIWRSPATDRIFSTTGQPNWLASVLTLTIPLAVLLAGSTESTTLRIATIGAGVIQIFVLGATLSRGGYLGLMTGVIVGLIVLTAMGKWRDAVKLAAAMTILAGAIVLILNNVSSRESRFDVIDRAASALDLQGFEVQRYIALWEVGFAIAADNALLGTGQDTYAEQFPIYRDRVLDESLSSHFAAFRPESPHNLYVSIASGIGYVALGAFLGAAIAVILFISLSVRSGRAPALMVAIVVALIGHMTAIAFITLELSGSLLFWGLLGSCSSLFDPGRDPTSGLV